LKFLPVPFAESLWHLFPIGFGTYKGDVFMRIVSICPSNTEILYFLGIEASYIVGLDDYSDWPKDYQHIPRLGPDLSINTQKLKELQPDLVVASLSVPGMEKNIERLNEESIPYIVLDPKTIWDVAEDILTCGSALGIEQRAEEVAYAYRSQLQHLKDAVPRDTTRRKRLYWEWWPKPIFSPGKRNWLTDVSQLVGAQNIFEDIDQESVRTARQAVMDRQPDLTLIVWTGVEKHRIKKQMITQRPEWKGQSFATDSNIHILEEGWYCRPSPRLLTGIQHLLSLLYDCKPPISEEDPLQFLT
jgi:iron complex transport system substrate-binding protein